jgi:multidrug resistance efflux pump
MSQPADTELPRPSANGELINRVQQLRLDGQLGQGTGQNRGSWLPWVICAMLAIAWIGVGVRSYKAVEPVAEAAAPQPSAASPAGSTPSGGQREYAKGELLLQIKGILTPFVQINFSPDDVAGVVTEIHFKEGDQVKKGQLLARIRPTRYQNDRDAARAALEAAISRLDELKPESVREIEKEQAKAEQAEAEANRIRAEKDLERLKNSKPGVVSSQDWDKAVADLRAAEAREIRLEKAYKLILEGPRKQRIDAARSDVDSARAKYLEAERLLQNCTICSPIDGTILTKVADPGVLVSPTSFNVASGICTMADLSDLEAEIDVREDQITLVQPGLECQIAAIANPGRVYQGRVDRIMPIADDTKNTIKVRVKVRLPAGESPGSFLKPKMSTVVRVYKNEIPPFDRKK